MILCLFQNTSEKISTHNLIFLLFQNISEKFSTNNLITCMFQKISEKISTNNLIMCLFQIINEKISTNNLITRLFQTISEKISTNNLIMCLFQIISEKITTIWLRVCSKRISGNKTQIIWYYVCLTNQPVTKYVFAMSRPLFVSLTQPDTLPVTYFVVTLIRYHPLACPTSGTEERMWWQIIRHVLAEVTEPFGFPLHNSIVHEHVLNIVRPDQRRSERQDTQKM
jgi:hypothetical protein